MKKTLLSILLVAAFTALSAQEEKEVVTGASYVNDVFYSLENGNVETAARASWDLAFAIPWMKLGVSILVNTASDKGLELYTYDKGDIADWETLDTTGMNWIPMYNSLETFSQGAFNQNAPEDEMSLDYGWGSYNMISHMITGDSVYILKSMDDQYWKIWITERNPSLNTWEFIVDSLDGTGGDTILIDGSAYASKNFVYYSLDSKEVLDREPASVDWDLLFTKYTEMIQMGPEPVPYPVTGILTNEDHIQVIEARESGMDQSTFVTFEETSFTSHISTIGYDWKKFTGSGYSVVDTMVYFVKRLIEQDSTYYKVYFTAFSSSEGKYTFMQEKLSLVSAREHGRLPMLELYPNPAGDYLNVVFDHQGELSIQIIDMTGRTVYSRTHHPGGFTNLTLDVAMLDPGLFFLKLDSGAASGVLRFIKQ